MTFNFELCHPQTAIPALDDYSSICQVIAQQWS